VLLRVDIVHSQQHTWSFPAIHMVPACETWRKIIDFDEFHSYLLGIPANIINPIGKV